MKGCLYVMSSVPDPTLATYPTKIWRLRSSAVLYTSVVGWRSLRVYQVTNMFLFKASGVGSVTIL